MHLAGCFVDDVSCHFLILLSFSDDNELHFKVNICRKIHIKSTKFPCNKIKYHGSIFWEIYRIKCYNPLAYEIKPKIGYRLPIHRKCFRWSLHIEKSKFRSNVKRPLHVQAICANRVFAQIAWQCRVLFACLRKLLEWNQNSLIFFAQAANACAVWVLVCTNKPQYYSELTPCGCASCRYL